MEEKQIEFVKQALAHYEAKLAEETERFGILGISDAFIENNSRKVVDNDDDGGAGDMWAAISEQSGMSLHVDYVYGDPQAVFAILSKEPIPRPNQTHLLWAMIQFLKREAESPNEKVYQLDFYEGPYKLDVPADVEFTEE